MTATQTTTNPKFIVQHTTAGHWQVVEVARAGKSYDGVDYTSFEDAKAVRDRLNGAAPAVVETPAPSLPKPQDHLRKSAHRPARKPSRHNTVARLYANLTAYVTRANGDRTTAATYLTDTLGADADFVRRFGSPFGRTAAKVARELLGTEPARDGLALVGHRRLVRVFTYPAAVLAEASRRYARIAEIGA